MTARVDDMFHLISKLVLCLCTMNINNGGIQITSSGYILNNGIASTWQQAVCVCACVCVSGMAFVIKNKRSMRYRQKLINHKINKSDPVHPLLSSWDTLNA